MQNDGSTTNRERLSALCHFKADSPLGQYRNRATNEKQNKNPSLDGNVWDGNHSN